MSDTIPEDKLSRIPEFTEKWMKYGTSTEPLDKKKAEDAVLLSYDCAKIKRPEFGIVWTRSPLEAAATAAFLKAKASGSSKKIKKEDIESIPTDIRDFKKYDLSRQNLVDAVSEMLYGYHSAPWASYYDYCGEVLGMTKEVEPLRGVMACAQDVGWWAPYAQVAIVQERHCEVHLNARGQLHNPSGYAVKWPDGFGICLLSNVRIPENKEYVIFTPEKIRPEDIENERNAELRRLMLQQFPGGIKAFVEKGNFKVVDKCGANHKFKGLRNAKLLRRELPGDEDLVFLQMLNSTPEPDGTYKWYVDQVHPDCNTVLGAMAWRAHMTEEEYVPLIET